MSFEKMPPHLADLLMRERALALVGEKLGSTKHEIQAERARLEGRSGIWKSLPGRGQDRDARLRDAAGVLLTCDQRIKKAGSLAMLLGRDIGRWLECWLKMESHDYAMALAGHDHAADWTRFGYNFDLLIKSYRLGLHDLILVHKREQRTGARSQALADSIRRLLPTARQIEIDVEFFNRILARQAASSGTKPALQPDYSWCETTQQIADQEFNDALATLRELLAACTGFLANLCQIIKREQEAAEARAARLGQPATSFLQTQWDALKPAAELAVPPALLDVVIDETESLLTDGTITARFNQHLIQTMTLAPAQTAAERTVAAPPNDEEALALKARLRAELDEVARMKAELAARDRAIKAGEQKLRDAELAFADRRTRELADIEAAKAKLAELDAETKRQAIETEQARVKALQQIEETKVELVARASFLEESEQRLMTKGQEQLETLAELEQKEEDLMAIKRELNAMRKELGIPLVALRETPVDEFSE